MSGRSTVAAARRCGGAALSLLPLCWRYPCVHDSIAGSAHTTEEGACERGTELVWAVMAHDRTAGAAASHREAAGGAHGMRKNFVGAQAHESAWKRNLPCCKKNGGSTQIVATTYRRMHAHGAWFFMTCLKTKQNRRRSAPAPRPASRARRERDRRETDRESSAHRHRTARDTGSAGKHATTSRL